ncbi:glycosyltransferase family 4 protein [Mesoflavibacter zeaxanthinifaciens]|uniref:glycosyltransferase family 4 protein n=1 Tax=Mesoflavibacter zeaxanthinifaciens TaxID=393060 RepID=UPI003A939A88
MKLLYITNGINGAGGLERVLSIKASYLAEHYNYDVTILSLNENHLNPFYEFSDKINMVSIPVTGNMVKYIFSYKQGIKAIVDKIKPDVISVCDDGLKGFFIPKIVKTKAYIVYERHVSKLIEEKSNHGYVSSLTVKAKWWLMSCLAKEFSKFIVLTEGNREEWKSLNNLEVMPNPLSFYPNQSSPLDSNKVICIGKISYQKGQDLLLKAWDLLFEKHPDWKLELYGYANDDFLNVSDLSKKNIHYFPPEKNIMEKYLESSIYVMSSRYEGFGMVLTEAMACGVPCVSFNCNYGPADIIHEEVDGFLVEKENIEELASRISKLIDNDNLRQKMGANAKINVARFAPEKIVEQWDELFTKLK